MMKEFEKGVSFEEAENKIYGKELQISGVVLHYIVEDIVRFSKVGASYCEYWNQNYYSRIGIKKRQKKINDKNYPVKMVLDFGHDVTTAPMQLFMFQAFDVDYTLIRYITFCEFTRQRKANVIN